MPTRNLRYVIVEAGPCRNCGQDAADHSTEGLCVIGVAEPGPAYRGKQEYAFIDLDSGEVQAWAKVANNV
jgi:hypothetical protein